MNKDLKDKSIVELVAEILKIRSPLENKESHDPIKLEPMSPEEQCALYRRSRILKGIGEADRLVEELGFELESRLIKYLIPKEVWQLREKGFFFYIEKIAEIFNADVDIVEGEGPVDQSRITKTNLILDLGGVTSPELRRKIKDKLLRGLHKWIK